MKFIAQINILLCFLIFLISCDITQSDKRKEKEKSDEVEPKGVYEKIDKKWIWVTSDAGSKRRVREIEEADFNSFRVLENSNYAVDNHSVFLYGIKIQKADPQTFTTINNSAFAPYSRDNENVFLDHQIVIFADPNSFEILDFPYSKDNSNIYCGTIPLDLEKEEINSFIVTNNDKTLDRTKSSLLLSEFIRLNPDYHWLDTLGIDGVIVGPYSSGETRSYKIQGFRKVE